MFSAQLLPAPAGLQAAAVAVVALAGGGLYLLWRVTVADPGFLPCGRGAGSGKGKSPPHNGGSCRESSKGDSQYRCLPTGRSRCGICCDRASCLAKHAGFTSRVKKEERCSCPVPFPSGLAVPTAVPSTHIAVTSVPEQGSSPQLASALPAQQSPDTPVKGRECGGCRQLQSPALWAGQWGQLCVSCKIVRPLRAKHDPITDRCVESFDHFCPWVGNVIGRGNRHLFLAFLWVRARLCHHRNSMLSGYGPGKSYETKSVDPCCPFLLSLVSWPRR